jgi:hypothetical protein
VCPNVSSEEGVRRGIFTPLYIKSKKGAKKKPMDEKYFPLLLIKSKKRVILLQGREKNFKKF